MFERDAREGKSRVEAAGTEPSRDAEHRLLGLSFVILSISIGF